MDRGEAINDLHKLQNNKIRGPQSGLRRTNYIVHIERKERQKELSDPS